MTDIQPLPGAGRPERRILSLRGRGGFEALSTQWDELLLRKAKVRFFQHPDWYRALFASELADPDEFLFIALSDGPDLVGIFPLHIANIHKLGMAIHTIGLCNHPHIPLADGIIDDSREWTGLIGSLVCWLQEARPVEWEVLMLDNIPGRSDCCRLLSADPASRIVRAVTGASDYLPTESDAAALGPVSGSFKRNLRRLTKRAEESAPLRHAVYDTLPELEQAFPLFLEVEASGWKGAGGIGTAIAQDGKLIGFYRGLMERFGARGQCLISLLRHGEKVVATQFGLLVGGTCNILKIGYREDYAWFAPGNLAMEQTIRWCCARPEVRELSFVTSPPWGHLWKPQRETVNSFRIFNPTLKGRLLSVGLHMKHEYDRRRQRPGAAGPGAGSPEADAADAAGAGRPGDPADPSHSPSRGQP